MKKKKKKFIQNLLLNKNLCASFVSLNSLNPCWSRNSVCLQSFICYSWLKIWINIQKLIIKEFARGKSSLLIFKTVFDEGKVSSSQVKLKIELWRNWCEFPFIQNPKNLEESQRWQWQTLHQQTSFLWERKQIRGTRAQEKFDQVLKDPSKRGGEGKKRFFFPSFSQLWDAHLLPNVWRTFF